VDPQIFISYSSKDQKVARTICTTLENRGLACWISFRNVKPGQNHQEQIVKAIHSAKIMVLVFTAQANNSNEIKKELALASQNNLVVIPVRIEDVIPSGAFAYELATRQWIDMFDDWENSIAHLVELIAANIDEYQPGDRTKAPVGLTGGAAVLPSGKTVIAKTAPATAPVPFVQRPSSRWAMACGVAIIVAAGIAYEVAPLAWQPRSVPVTDTTGSPTPSQSTAPVASPVPTQPAAKQPQRPPSVQATLPTPSEPVAAPPQQIQNSTITIPPPAEAAAKQQVSQSVKDQCRTDTHNPDYDPLISACTSWITLDPTSAEAYSKRAQAYFITKRNDQAIDDATKALALSPDAASYETRGAAYQSKHLYDQAIADDTKAIGLVPKDPTYYEVRGQLYIEDGLYDQAIADFTKSLALGRAGGIYSVADFLEGCAVLDYVHRGYAYERKGLRDQAISDYRAAMRLSSNEFLMWGAHEGLQRLGAAPK
jgi:hypothetical protein